MMTGEAPGSVMLNL